MSLKRVSLEDLSGIQYAIYAESDARPVHDFMVVEFSGTCGIGSGSNDDALFMGAIVLAVLSAWSPSGLVLDLRNLSYAWGDQMTGVLCGGDPGLGFGYTPTTVAVSDRCREGLTSLLEREMGENPAEWLFDDLDSAIRGLGTKLEASEEAETVRPHRPRRRKRVP